MANTPADNDIIQYDSTLGFWFARSLDTAGLVTKSLYDANTILAANSDNTPAALTVAEQRLVGRITAGNIAALTAAQVRTLLALATTDNVTFGTLKIGTSPNYMQIAACGRMISYGSAADPIPIATDNATAAAAGVRINGFYRSNADPSVLMIRTA